MSVRIMQQAMPTFSIPPLQSKLNFLFEARTCSRRTSLYGSPLVLWHLVKLIGVTNGYSGSVNPFWNNGKLDVTHYLAVNSFPTPTAATIMLGDNDLSGASTDAATDSSIATMVVNLKAIVDALLAAGVESVGLVWQPPPGSQDGFGFDYGVMGNSGPPNFTQTGVSTRYSCRLDCVTLTFVRSRS